MLSDLLLRLTSSSPAPTVNMLLSCPDSSSWAAGEIPGTPVFCVLVKG